MINTHQYSLEKGSKKYRCPQCDKKTLVRYVDIETNNYLPEDYGRCDRESKCAYHLNPYLDGYAKTLLIQQKGSSAVFANNRIWSPKPGNQPNQNNPVFFDFNTFKKTLEPENYQKNNFIQNLLSNINFPFDATEVTEVIQLYRLGTIASGYRAGAITFPFIDVKNNVRTIQVKQFDESNHTLATDFLHSILEKEFTRNKRSIPEWLEAYTKNETKISCLFGEHLLSIYPLNPIALVEAPKTAIYGTLYFGLPESPKNMIWLAVYNKSSFSFDKLKVLKGKDVYTFPDLSKDGNTFKEWQSKAANIEKQLPGTRFIFSDLLENLATEELKESGADIADILIKHDWRLFRKHPQPLTLSLPKGQPQPQSQSQPQPQPAKEPLREKCAKSENLNNTFIFPKEIFSPPPLIKSGPQEKWDKLIKELETYFASIEFPNQPIKLNTFSTITNTSKFIQSHFDIVKAQNGKHVFLPYLLRLQDLKRILLIHKN